MMNPPQAKQVEQEDPPPTSVFVFLAVVFLPVIILIAAIAYPCLLIISLAMLPLLLVSLIIIRIFQLVRYGRSYNLLTRFKHFVRGWLYIDVLVLLVGLWIFYLFAKFVPSLKPATILDLHLTRWVVVISLICVFYLVSFFFYKATHYITKKIHNIVENANIPQVSSEIIDGLLFWWAKHEVMKRVPAFRRHELLGWPTGKWIRVSILLLIGYNLVTLFTQLIVFLLRHVCKKCSTPNHDCSNQKQSIWQHLLGKQLQAKYVVYFANGMRLRITFIMSSLMLLLTWIFYFGTRLDMNVGSVQSVWELGKWTFTCLFICSFLWLIKSFVLLAWEANTVYRRLESKIQSISEQLYFLGLLGKESKDKKKYDFFKLPKHHENNNNNNMNKQDDDLKKDSVCGANLANCIRSISAGFTSSDYIRVTKEATSLLITQKKERIKRELLLGKDPTVDDLQCATRYFLTAHKYLQKKKYVSHILSHHSQCHDLPAWKNCVDPNDGKENSELLTKTLRKVISFDSSRKHAGEKENSADIEQNRVPQSYNSSHGKRCNISSWNRFAELVGTHSENSITDIQFQTWVERAHNKCMFLANTLSSAHEVGNSLNKIISGILIGATFLMWLLLSGLATTQVLVLIASPLLAATFIFGESCKSMFEGILFVYVIHPLDVGDLCLIDGNTMVVTAIDIWKTTFSEVDKEVTREVVIYPNAQLKNQIINNYRTKFNWSDCLEFSLDDAVKSSTKTHNKLIDHVKKKIQDSCLSSRTSGSPKLTILAKEDGIKLVIRLTYEADATKGWTYAECYREKDKLQAQFYLLVQKIIENYDGIDPKSLPPIDETTESF